MTSNLSQPTPAGPSPLSHHYRSEDATKRRSGEGSPVLQGSGDNARLIPGMK